MNSQPNHPAETKTHELSQAQASASDTVDTGSSESTPAGPVTHDITAYRIDDETPLSEIAPRMQANPELAAAIVKMANCSSHALKRQIESVEHAMAMLGRRRVQETINRFFRHDRPGTAVPAKPHFATRADRQSKTPPAA